MIARIHHRLNSYEGVQTIEFKKFLRDFGRDFAAMVSSEESPEQIIIEGIEINLPATTAIPLGFIASEMITNAAKYGKSRITMRLEPDAEHGYALSVSNDGPALPEGFDPDAGEGLGMKIIRCFPERRLPGFAFATVNESLGWTTKKPPVRAASRALVRPSANRDDGLCPSRSDDRDRPDGRAHRREHE